MATYTKDSGKPVSFMAKVHLLSLMDPLILVPGLKTFNKALAKKFGLMVPDTKANIKTA